MTLSSIAIFWFWICPHSFSCYYFFFQWRVFSSFFFFFFQLERRYHLGCSLSSWLFAVVCVFCFIRICIGWRVIELSCPLFDFIVYFFSLILFNVLFFWFSIRSQKRKKKRITWQFLGIFYCPEISVYISTLLSSLPWLFQLRYDFFFLRLWMLLACGRLKPPSLTSLAFDGFRGPHKFV